MELLTRNNFENWMQKVLERIEKRPGSTQKQLTENDHNYLFDHLPEELVSYMEEVRLGKREL